MKEIIVILFMIFEVIFSKPAGDLVVSSLQSLEAKEDGVPVDPVIYEMDIFSNISNRFANTLVTSKVRNLKLEPKETTFTVVLPEKAFISEFVLKIGGKSYKAYVKEKEEAKKIYEKARARGQTAGHVAVNARDSNQFSISVNIEPEAKAIFLLTYEELLERKNNQYELLINIHPGQVIEKMNIKVLINESKPLSFVRTPSLRSGNEIEKNQENSNNLSNIEIIEESSAIVKFQPDTEHQKEFARKMGTEESEGLSGQFVVQYDVVRDLSGGEVLLQDGYFVHFFAPDDLQPLPKHITFVLDTSGSMSGQKIQQLKDAMYNILDQLQQGDVVSIVEFNTGVYVWNAQTGKKKETPLKNYEDPFSEIDEIYLPPSAPVNDNETITKAKQFIDKLVPGGSTNIIGGLGIALSIIKSYTEEKTTKEHNLQPLVMFLTDGQPIGISSANTQESITRIVTKLNSGNTKVPVFTLSFGDGADKAFLRKLSLQNAGFSRHIYEAADASLQLQNFYKEISVPLLSNIKFEYADAANVTKEEQPVFFRGSEIAICGVYDVTKENPLGTTKIRGRGNSGSLLLRPTIEKPVSSLERLWAYLTVKQKLEKRETADEFTKQKLTKEATNLALKYSFVTDVTSLVVVKPNDTSDSLTPIDMSIPRGYPPRPSVYYSRIGLPARAPSSLAPSTPYGSHYSMQSGLAGGPQSLHISGFTSADSDMIMSAKAAEPERQRVHDIPTTFRPLYVTSTMSSAKLANTLTWLSSVLSSTKTLNINEGVYYLGESSLTSLSRDICPNTPSNETGNCTLLKDCPQVHSYLTDFQEYKKFFCPVDKQYAGVCCPNWPTTNNS